MECLKCKHDLDKFANWNSFLSEIECPECKTKYEVDGDDVYNSKTSEEYSIFWLNEI